MSQNVVEGAQSWETRVYSRGLMFPNFFKYDSSFWRSPVLWYMCGVCSTPWMFRLETAFPVLLIIRLLIVVDSPQRCFSQRIIPTGIHTCLVPSHIGHRLTLCDHQDAAEMTHDVWEEIMRSPTRLHLGLLVFCYRTLLRIYMIWGVKATERGYM